MTYYTGVDGTPASWVVLLVEGAWAEAEDYGFGTVVEDSFHTPDCHHCLCLDVGK